MGKTVESKIVTVMGMTHVRLKDNNSRLIMASYY